MKKNYIKPSWANVALFTFLLGGSSAFGQLYEFGGDDNEHIFNPCGATGREGPTSAMCDAEYAGEEFLTDDAYFFVDDAVLPGIQQWTVPATGDYRIEVAGAQGGNHLYTVDPEDGGLGAIMIGTFALVEGDIYYILVGQQGDPSQEGGGGSEDNAAPGGGGGSFIWDPDATEFPLIAAGGGGAGASPGGYAPKDANITEDGSPTQGLSNGGTGGNGGGVNNGACSWWAGAGAGWNSNGTGGNNTSIYNYNPGTQGAEGGRTPLNGGYGGIRWNDGFDEGGDGGFGGGGGGGSDNMNGGGGGGYSGGGGGRGCEISPGGGGSYNSGIDQDNSIGNTGMGYVKITLLCNPLIADIPVTGVCEGEELYLSATSATGGIISWDLGVIDGEFFAPPLGTTTYSATSTSPDDCAFSIDISSTVIPIVTAHSDALAACEASPVIVWGDGAIDYVWSGTGAVTPIDSVAFTAEPGTTTYTVIGSVLGCEGEPAEITLTGAPQPDVVANVSEDKICLGESYTLSGGGVGATSFDWGGGIEDGETLTPETAGTFIHTVIGTSDLGCGDTASVAVVVYPLPFVGAGSDVTICQDNEVTLTGTGAESYSWTGGVMDGIPFEALPGETTYTVTGTDANGCSDDDDVVVLGIERPTITDDAVEDEYFGADGYIEITVTGGSGSYLFDWSHGPVTEDVYALVGGTYTVIVSDIETHDFLCPTEKTWTIDSFVGLEDESAEVISAYPNPTTDLLTVTYEGAFNYEITNAAGQIVYSGQAVDKTDVSMKELANGQYIVKVIAGENVHFVQIIKQ